MSTTLVHLLVRYGGRRVACGATSYKQSSMEPANVTCKGCQRSLLMADREIAGRTQSLNRGR